MKDLHVKVQESIKILSRIFFQWVPEKKSQMLQAKRDAKILVKEEKSTTLRKVHKIVSHWKQPRRLQISRIYSLHLISGCTRTIIRNNSTNWVGVHNRVRGWYNDSYADRKEDILIQEAVIRMLRFMVWTVEDESEMLSH
ncbi:hypothetical protein Tco_1367722 [Tanacetum coccineum]